MNQITPLDAGHDTPLRFSIRDGEVANEFLRHGPLAVHVLLGSGNAPRLLFAFPAGNSALALWLKPGAPVAWGPLQRMEPVSALDPKGRPVVGVRAEVELDAAAIELDAVVMSSARVLRDFLFDRRLPPGLAQRIEREADCLTWSRDRIDGAPGYALRLRALGGAVSEADGVLRLQAAPGARLRLEIVATCGETPLTPLGAGELLAEPDAGPLLTRQSLAFLAYREKMLAGSWRFNTYFGRDTLMSLLLLLPALAPAGAEAGLGSVLDRIGEGGEVAHEEDIGEFALLRGSADGAPIHDYKMVDDDFMLAPLAVAYLLEHPRGRERAAGFLDQASPQGGSRRAALAANAALVLQLAQAFAERPGVAALIRLKPGHATGDWRDSEDGLGGGTISYNVNAVLVPAALRAVAALFDSGLLGAPDAAAAARARTMAAVWEREAPPCFAVERTAAEAREAVRRHAAETGAPPEAALASLPAGPLRFAALALHDDGTPVPVMHSDHGFALMLQDLPAAEIEAQLAVMMRPFPAGLMTGAGLLVANAAQGDAALRGLFGPDRYHGAVVWSWQQALLAAGLARQRARSDLPASTLEAIAAAEAALWEVISRTRAQGNSELWTWAWTEAGWEVRPFGPGAATPDESNAAQLWSTVYLALRPPGRA